MSGSPSPRQWTSTPDHTRPEEPSRPALYANSFEAYDRQGHGIPNAMSLQPSMGLTHTPFSPSPAYQYARASEGNMMPHNYQPVIQHQGPVPDGALSAHLSQDPHSLRAAYSMASHASQSPPVHSPVYESHPSRYQTPYAYPPQSFPTFTAHQSLYALRAPDPQTYASPTVDTDGWYHMPQGGSSRQHQGEPPYQGHYPVGYSPVGAAQPPSRSVQQRGFLPRRPDAPSPSSPLHEQPAVRRPHHPHSHAHEWVMWAGNVPSDSSQDELWRFFNDTPASTPPTSKDRGGTGILSIFLLSRTRCAFVNFKSEACLQTAISSFNGRSLRPDDPKCLALVCKVRTKDDDRAARTGGREKGMHVRNQKGKAASTKAESPSEQSQSDGLPQTLSIDRHHFSVLTPPRTSFNGQEGGPAQLKEGSSSNSGSGSFASTNSSMLARYFPKRYFILKSLTQHDLDLSTKNGLWATQKHNEGILDQAYRTSQEVYLIFGVNQTSAFYGYAKMAGPIFRESSHDFFPPTEHRLVGASPQPYTTAEEAQSEDNAAIQRPESNYSQPLAGASTWASAPAEMKRRLQTMSLEPLPQKFSLDQYIGHKPKPSDGLSPHSYLPITTVGGSPVRLVVPEDDERKGDSVDSVGLGEAANSGRLDGGGRPEPQVDGLGQSKEHNRGDNRGQPFKVEWFYTDRLPFSRTRHICNPWNNNRTVKISRDGTELEPSVGAMLIVELEKARESRVDGEAVDDAQAAARHKPGIVGGRNRRGGRAPIMASKTRTPGGITA